jgi:hypothetical protein
MIDLISILAEKRFATEEAKKSWAGPLCGSRVVLPDVVLAEVGHDFRHADQQGCFRFPLSTECISCQHERLRTFAAECEHLSGRTPDHDDECAWLFCNGGWWCCPRSPCPVGGV